MKRSGGLCLALLLAVVVVLPGPAGGQEATAATQSCSFLPPGAVCQLSKYPYLNAVANWLNFRSRGAEGKIWWASVDNSLPAHWLLQTPNCWGKDSCPDPAPGATTFIDHMQAMVSHAQRTVDVAELWPPPTQDFVFALARGLEAAVKRVGASNLTVRVLIGVYPGAIPLGWLYAGIDCLKAIGLDLSAVTQCKAGAIEANPAIYTDYLRQLVDPKLRVQVAFTYSDLLTSWDHQKLIDVDGREAILGGMNYWTDDYLRTTHPVNDVSMQMEGPAAADALLFDDVLWNWTCEHRPKDVSSANLGSCVKHATIVPFSRPPGQVPILTVGRLGDGIPVPDAAEGTSSPINPPALSGKCGLASNQSNDDPRYEFRNPAEDAVRALITRATTSIFISQQDLLGCSLYHEAKFDERLFGTLALKVAQHVPIKIVLSAGIGKSGGLYQNGYTLQDVATILTRIVQIEHEQRTHNPFSFKQAQDLVCGDVGLTLLRNGPAAKWRDGHGFGNHAKLVEVDDKAFYIGSQNLYPARLQELGFIVEDPNAAQTLNEQYLTPMWRYSREGALIDPGRTCGTFGGAFTQYWPPILPN